MKSISKLLSIALVFGATLTFAQDETVEESARALVEKYRPTLVVVTVKGDVETLTTGEPLPVTPQQRRTLGMTIRENGLIVVSNSAIDPTVGVAGQQANIDGKLVTISSAKMKFTDVEISYGDKTLLRGKVVRQDVSADVAFILPDAAEVKAASKTFDAVDLSKFATDAEVADQVVGLGRSTPVYGYMPTLIMGRITGVYQKERIYYLSTVGTTQGMPVFTIDGRPLGFTVVRVIDGKPTRVLGTLSAGSIQAIASLIE